MKKLFIIALTLVLSLVATSAAAQETGVNSPYSRYGIGRLADQSQGFNQGMSGLAFGMRDGRELNYKNPASYSAIDSLTFLCDIGMSLQNGNFAAGKSATNVRNASFDYFSMGFRINRGLGMSIGMMPISNIGYSVSTVGNQFDGGLTGDITPTVSYSGNGGLRELYGGIGYAPIKQLSVGANVGYMWGTMTHTATNRYTDNSVQSVNRVYYSDIRSYKVSAALQWDQKVNSKNSFVVGLAYTLGHDLSAKASLYNQRVGSSTILAADTAVVKNAWSVPHIVGAGLTWRYSNSLRVGLDYEFQQWSQAHQPLLVGGNYIASSSGYSDTHRLTLGAEFVKDPNGLSRASRVRYRAGFSYANGYAKIDGSDAPRTYLASVGVALPIINIFNNRTFINIAAQYERVEPKVAGFVTENYFRLCLGVTFNERWFMKWKVE